MKRALFVLFFLSNATLHAQKEDTSKTMIWGFPITSYMVPLKAGVDVVQIKLPARITFVEGKQIGVLRGVAEGSNVDTGNKGWGKCHLIKGEFNYFAIHLEGKSKPKKGDLVYTMIPKKAVGYFSPIVYCAAHGVIFKDVEDSAFYKLNDFLEIRTRYHDDALTDRMLKDIRRTGKYYLETDSTMNKPINEGPYSGKRMLDIMASVKENDLGSFLGYVAARPRRYAGNSWKISETFATWLISGAPMVVGSKGNSK